MGEPVYRGYDQEALDWQYDNRRRARVSADYVAFYQAASIAARNTLPCTLDISFGQSDAEVLDIFGPAKPGLPVPVHMFIHGGYWRALHKDDFSFVATPIVEAGGMAVVVNYALMPGVTMDELVRQCRAALAWLYQNAGDYGGDPDRITISGHSAGGHLVTMMLATDWGADYGLPQDVVKGGVALSGLYDLEPIRLCYLNKELGMDEETARRNSPINCLPDIPAGTAPPLVLTYGSLESEEFARQTAVYADAWRARGHDCTVDPIAGHHHMSVISTMADRDSPLTCMIAAQMGLS